MCYLLGYNLIYLKKKTFFNIVISVLCTSEAVFMYAYVV